MTISPFISKNDYEESPTDTQRKENGKEKDKEKDKDKDKEDDTKKLKENYDKLKDYYKKLVN